MSRPVSQKNSQAGMASILITMITMVVVSLIVLGFATISRREQGNTLDQQLSTQAFYAAESGVEDARNVIKQDINTPAGIPPKTNCTSDDTSKAYKVNYPTGNTMTLDAADNVSYSCLLVNPVESSIIYSGIGAQSKVVPINASGVIDKIQISWTSASGNTSNCPASTNHTLSPATGWNCGYGLMSVDLVPTNGALTRNGLETSQLTAFFEPQNKVVPGAGVAYGAGRGRANIIAADCTQGNITLSSNCTATITGLSSLGSKSFSLRLNSLYKTSSKVEIQVSGQGGQKLTITGTQVTVDVTGKANGVLRRIQVRIPTVESSNLIPDQAIETNGALCKRFEVTPGYYANAGDVVNPAPKGSPYYNAMCDNSVTSGTPSAGG